MIPEPTTILWTWLRKAIDTIFPFWVDEDVAFVMRDLWNATANDLQQTVGDATAGNNQLPAAWRDPQGIGYHQNIDLMLNSPSTGTADLIQSMRDLSAMSGEYGKNIVWVKDQIYAELAANGVAFALSFGLPPGLGDFVRGRIVSGMATRIAGWIATAAGKIAEVAAGIRRLTPALAKELAIEVAEEPLITVGGQMIDQWRGQREGINWRDAVTAAQAAAVGTLIARPLAPIGLVASLPARAIFRSPGRLRDTVVNGSAAFAVNGISSPVSGTFVQAVADGKNPWEWQQYQKAIVEQGIGAGALASMRVGSHEAGHALSPWGDAHDGSSGGSASSSQDAGDVRTDTDPPGPPPSGELAKPNADGYQQQTGEANSSGTANAGDRLAAGHQLGDASDGGQAEAPAPLAGTAVPGVAAATAAQAPPSNLQAPNAAVAPTATQTGGAPAQQPQATQQNQGTTPQNQSGQNQSGQNQSGHNQAPDAKTGSKGSHDPSPSSKRGPAEASSRQEDNPSSDQQEDEGAALAEHRMALAEPQTGDSVRLEAGGAVGSSAGDSVGPHAGDLIGPNAGGPVAASAGGAVGHEHHHPGDAGWRSNQHVVDRGDGLPRTQETVAEVAAAAGVELNGAEVVIVEGAAEIRYLDQHNAYARVRVTEGGYQIRLGPASFVDRATLAATLAHEQTHVEQYRAERVGVASVNELESEAYASEAPALERLRAHDNGEVRGRDDVRRRGEQQRDPGAGRTADRSDPERYDAPHGGHGSARPRAGSGVPLFRQADGENGRTDPGDRSGGRDGDQSRDGTVQPGLTSPEAARDAVPDGEFGWFDPASPVADWDGQPGPQWSEWHRYGQNEARWLEEPSGRGRVAQARLRETYRVKRSHADDVERGNARARGVKGDQGGHAIGWRFFPLVFPPNYFPQNGTLNHGAFEAFENEIAAWIEAGKDVELTVYLTPNQGRPDSVTFVYQVTDAGGQTIYTGGRSFENQRLKGIKRFPTPRIRAFAPDNDPVFEPDDERTVAADRPTGPVTDAVTEALGRREVLAAAGVLEVVDMGNGRYRVETAGNEAYHLDLAVGPLEEGVVADYYAEPGTDPIAEVTLSDLLTPDAVPMVVARILAETAAATLDPSTDQLNGNDDRDTLTPAGEPDLHPRLSPKDRGDLAEARLLAFLYEQASSPFRRAAIAGQLALLIESMSLGKDQPNADLLRKLLPGLLDAGLVERFRDRQSPKDNRLRTPKYLAKAAGSSIWTALLVGAAAYAATDSWATAVATAAPSVVAGFVGAFSEHRLDKHKSDPKRPAYDADRKKLEHQHRGLDGMLDGEQPAEPIDNGSRGADPKHYKVRHLVPASAGLGAAVLLWLGGFPALPSALAGPVIALVKSYTERMNDVSKRDARRARVAANVARQLANPDSAQNQLIRVLQEQAERLRALRAYLEDHRLNGADLSGHDLNWTEPTVPEGEITTPDPPSLGSYAGTQSIDGAVAGTARGAVAKRPSPDLDPTDLARRFDAALEVLITAIGTAMATGLLGAVGDKIFADMEEAATYAQKSWDYAQREAVRGQALIDTLAEPLHRLNHALHELAQLAGAGRSAPDLTDRTADRSVVPAPPKHPDGPRPKRDLKYRVYAATAFLGALGATTVFGFDGVFDVLDVTVFTTVAAALGGFTGTPIAKMLFQRAQFARKDANAAALNKQGVDPAQLARQSGTGRYLIAQLMDQIDQLTDLLTQAGRSPVAVSPADADYTDRVRAAVERAFVHNQTAPADERSWDRDVRQDRIDALQRIDRLAAAVDWADATAPGSADAAAARARLAHAINLYEAIDGDGAPRSFPDLGRVSPARGQRVTGGPTDQVRAGAAKALGRMLGEPAGKRSLADRLELLESIVRAAYAVDAHADHALMGAGTEASLADLRAKLDELIADYEKLLIKANILGGFPRPAISPATPPDVSSGTAPG
ncbi:DNA/RNA non-specific endonuclease [Kribbella antiqua]|uniref:DNA/RNA non-specific endonuclease n=1 Tax=Kribbella antiqua TaxID=2512217 RepID=A0A4R2ILZ8_9ACTN|nr:DNA/RNA non-specific endonuclease [Kribbella antiqua]TCO43705.1 DNA/RNA non-specific endonuclease [Kribbella antiqua]